MNEQRRLARARSRHQARVRAYQQEFAQLSTDNPLSVERARQLLPELAQRSCGDVVALYRAGARLWHPDAGGDQQVFQLLQAAYDVLRNEPGRNDFFGRSRGG
ncbi:J domain-containing protein [Streptomyces filamentosus]|uniref:J domain-containing protein n=1 Tax=Streptomyces filamentosus TaxID=67294 RepID=UPI003410590F